MVFFPYRARLSFSRIWKSSASGAERIGVKVRILLLDTKPPKGSVNGAYLEGHTVFDLVSKLCRSGGFHVTLTPHPLAGLQG